MAKTSIEWATDVWNPTTGCAKVSQGCAHCYAETIAKRFWGERKFTDVQCHPDRLEQPLHWRKPRRVFVNSMSDLFHKDVPLDFILRVWMVMARACDYTFMILTKRPERMLMFVNEYLPGTWGLATMNMRLLDKPIPNVWLGVSVEDQRTADERIPLLMKTPAAVRFVSAEPLLGPVDLEIGMCTECGGCGITAGHYFQEDGMDTCNACGGSGKAFDKLDWVICGGESGPGARPMHPDWARSLRDQCQAAGVPFFFKQWGEYCFPSQLLSYGAETYADEKDPSKWYQWRVGKKAAGRLLDGREWNEYPGEGDR